MLLNLHGHKHDTDFDSDVFAVIVNEADSISVIASKKYIIAINRVKFQKTNETVDAATPWNNQVYARAWVIPNWVERMSITTEYAAGFDEYFCSSTARQAPRFLDCNQSLSLTEKHA
jgi:hypothetical protein